MPDQSKAEGGLNGDSPAARIALKVSSLHADLLSSLHEEIGTNGERFAEAAQRLAGEFGSLTAAVVDAAQGARRREHGFGPRPAGRTS